MKIPVQELESGVLPQSQNFTFAVPLQKKEAELFYYISWCGHFYCTEKYFQKREHYPYCLIMYVQRGKFHREYRDFVFDAQAGDVILLDCVEPHYYSAFDGLEFLYICFDGFNAHELCQYYLKKKGPLIRSERNQLLKNFLLNTVAFFEGNRYEKLIDTSMRVYTCFPILFSEEDIKQKGENNDMARILSYIHNHISEKLSMEHLAGIQHFSTSHFSHMFKRETGLSPAEYIINVRMNQAKILLINSQKSIGEIAEETGYASSASFSNVFANRIGCSPQQFRKLKGGIHYANTRS